MSPMRASKILNAKQSAAAAAAACALTEPIGPGRWTIWSVHTEGPVRPHAFGGWLVALANGADTAPMGATWVTIETDKEGMYLIRSAHYGDAVCAGKHDPNLKASSRLMPAAFRVELVGKEEGVYAIKQTNGELVWTVADAMTRDQALLHIALKPTNSSDTQKFRFVSAMISPW